MKATFVRHGQSTGNAGIPCDDLALLSLTELGWQQARKVAVSWTQTPDLIVTSSYLRTQQTAAPTVERFPGVRVEVWPTEEFTYLQPSRWNGTLSAERMPHIVRYWEKAEPPIATAKEPRASECFFDALRRLWNACRLNRRMRWSISSATGSSYKPCGLWYSTQL